MVPRTTAPRMRALIEGQGAELIVEGAVWDEAHHHAVQQLDEQTAYISPFDDPLLWQGHATLIDEVVADGLQPDAVLLAVGGGGLLCGVIYGLRRNGLEQVPVIAVETAGAASLAGSLRAGRLVTLPRIDTLATSLGAKRVAEQAFREAQIHPVQSLVVSDREAIAACCRFADEHRVLVEPACGATLAAVYEHASVLAGFARVLIVVCGRAGVSRSLLDHWCDQVGLQG